MKHALSLSLLIAAFFLSLNLHETPKAFAWGQGVHSSLTAHAHERMTARWKGALHRGLMMHGSQGPDMWYALSDSFMELLCHTACGGENGSIANECWNHNYDPDRWFHYTRHLLAQAKSLEQASWFLGYGAHAVEDFRGHLEYIIPSYRNPGSDKIISRHTFIDTAAAALIFNVDGYGGYPSRFTMDRIGLGYLEGGFLTEENYNQGGARDARRGLVVEVVEDSNGDAKIKWTGEIDAEYTGLNTSEMNDIFDNAALSAASEGILAHGHGQTSWDSGDASFPIFVEEGEVAIVCETDMTQRIDGENGWGGTLACQIGYGAISGLPIWPKFLKTGGESGQEVVVDLERVHEWIDRINHDYDNGGVRLDDNAVFEIDEDTKQSTAHIQGIDGRDFTFGKTMPEIVEEVLELSVLDTKDRLLENGHMIGTLLQSGMKPTEKARFVEFGFHYRPRMSTWPETLPYQGEQVSLAPASSEVFSKVQIPFDMSAPDQNAAMEMVYPYYLVFMRPEREEAHGQGRLKLSAYYETDDGEKTPISDYRYDLQTSEEAAHEDYFVLATDSINETLFAIIDNSAGGEMLYANDGKKRAVVFEIALEITDENTPPYDYLFDIVVNGYCERPNFFDLADPPDTNAHCLFQAPNVDGDIDEMETELDDEDESEEALGEVQLETQDETHTTDEPPLQAANAEKGGCKQTRQTSRATGFLLLFFAAFIAIRIKTAKTPQK